MYYRHNGNISRNWHNQSFLPSRGSHLIIKPAKWPERQAKTYINMGIRPVCSESPLCALRIAKDLKLLHADSKDSDQTGRMPRLIWVNAGRTCHFIGLWCCGSYVKLGMISLPLPPTFGTVVIRSYLCNVTAEKWFIIWVYKVCFWIFCNKALSDHLSNS